MGSHFDRVPAEFRPVIERAWDALPRRVAESLSPHALCGISPNFVGLHSQTEVIGYEGTLNDNAHVCYSYGAADGVSRIVFPQLGNYRDPVSTVIHEFGHLYHEVVHFRLDAPETTEYSELNRWERFAEAFETLLWPPSGEWRDYMAAEAFKPLRDALGIPA